MGILSILACTCPEQQIQPHKDRCCMRRRETTMRRVLHSNIQRHTNALRTYTCLHCASLILCECMRWTMKDQGPLVYMLMPAFVMSYILGQLNMVRLLVDLVDSSMMQLRPRVLRTQIFSRRRPCGARATFTLLMFFAHVDDEHD